MLYKWNLVTLSSDIRVSLILAVNGETYICSGFDVCLRIRINVVHSRLMSLPCCCNIFQTNNVLSM